MNLRRTIGRWVGWTVGGVLLLAAAALVPLPASAQVAVEAEPKPTGFTIRKEDTSVLNAFEDFERYRDKSEWEKAFRALTTAADAPVKGMVPAADGFLVPKTQRIRDLLASLPAPGSDAYRLFNDSKAKQLYDEYLRQEAEDGKADPVALRKIVEQYFVTATGDDAANHLGDLYFEAGDFLAADAMWNAILTAYPDTDLPAARLLAKRATALMRAKRAEALAQAYRTIPEETSKQTVRIAGRDVLVGDYVAGLVRHLETTTTTTTAPTTRDVDPSSDTSSVASVGATIAPALPASDAPAWQIAFQDKDTADKIDAAAINMGWGGMLGSYTKLVPPVAVAGDRIFVNWLGVGFAADLTTGKMLWRTDKFADLGAQAQNFVQMARSTDRYYTAAAGERVLFVRLPLNRLNEHQAPYSISCHAAADGQRRWTSESGALSNWSFVGRPLVLDDTVYACAHPRNGQEVSLLAIALETGRLEWTLLLGTPASSVNYRGDAQMPIPTLAHAGGVLYVLTNNGALLAVSRTGRRVEWALATEGKAVAGDEVRFFGYYAQPGIELPGTLLIRDGTLYAKETGASQMYAVDLSGASPSLAWKRPVDATDTIAGMDERFVYLLGPHLSAVELPGRAMRWSTAVPTDTSSLRPLVGEGAALVSGSRGVYRIDTTTGDVQGIFRGADKAGVGGALLVADDKLITVSNTAITAYPIPAKDGPAAARSGAE